MVKCEEVEHHELYGSQSSHATCIATWCGSLSCTRGSFLQGNSSQSMKLTTYLRFFATLEKEWNYTSIPPCVSMACKGINLPLLLGHTLTNFSPFNNTLALLITLLSAIYTYTVTSRVEVSMGFHIVAFWIMKSYQVLVDHTASIFRTEDQNMKWVVTSIGFKDHLHKLHKMRAWLGANIQLHILSQKSLWSFREFGIQDL